ncbi:Na+/H+ antiporter subunit E [Azohydromonas sediminis]|uniref:Na+/H+ antiporter subunit E n=1 Tax=Azohydromonas sediminis TaxID=2259674 RepID=UPI000E64E94D|nr:Na+/H+ antiporter subunit E [Azohydromonas sediminis]
MTPRHDRRDDGGWLAHPALSVLLAVVWLLLRQSVEPADLIAAVVLGLVVPRLTHRFLGPASNPRALGTALRFTFVVLWDIVVSNVTVARIVLNPASAPKPAWVPVPLDTQHPTAITLLATIITTTPGTVSCVVDDAHGQILVHALDCDDPAEMAAQIKQRYERPLMEIFG